MEAKVSETTLARYKEYVRGFRIRSKVYSKTFLSPTQGLTGHFKDLHDTMRAKCGIGPSFSQPAVVSDLTADCIADVSAKLHGLVEEGV